MPNNLSDPAESVDNTSRPLQIVPWSAKTPEWYKRNVEFCIMRTNFNFGAQTNGRKDLRLFYEIYNNNFPLDWFNHITNPLGTLKEEHKRFPAKIRPVTILRPNIDLLMAEYPRRPFIYTIENLGDDGYSSYMDGLMKKIEGTLTQQFVQAVINAKQEAGEQLNQEQMQQLQQNPPTPEEVQAEYQLSYKDALVIKANKWLKRRLRNTDTRKKLLLMFKDWLIAGQCYSSKCVENDELVYRRISPLNIDYDKSMDNEMIEDGEWGVIRYLWPLSDVVDKFYPMLSEKQHNEIEFQYWSNSPVGYYENLRGIFTDPQERNKIPVYHVQWKGKKKIGFLSYLDMETLQYVEEVVDEDYVVDKARGEQVEWRWVNEVYEGYRIGRDMYVGFGPKKVQRSELNNHSACKLDFNGRKFSDTHSENISLLEIGLPFQLLYIIITYILEKTIAKSKGKILLIDQNAIPDDEDWDDEKFFYYAEALGYGLLNRNQIGVDKTWNQYQVLDMSLFDQIKQLIELQDYCKQQWDDTCGINRQRKGETYASDGQGVNERATFQSTVMTDMIFIRFEEFVEKELQGFIDYLPYLTSKGERSVWTDDDLGTQIMEIFPEDFSLSQLGVFMGDTAMVMDKLKQARGLAQAIIQNEGKLSMALEVMDADNFSELKKVAKQLEQIENNLAEQQSENEHQRQQELEEIQARHMQLQSNLDIKYLREEYALKEELAYVEGELALFTNDKGDKVEDATAAETLLAQREKLQADIKDKTEKRKIDRDKLQMQRDQQGHQQNMDKKNLQMQQDKNKKDHEHKMKKLAVDKMKAKQRPKSSK